MRVGASERRARRKEPERTCFGCRRKAGRSELLRFVRSPQGELVYDDRRTLGGRGLWVCPSRECLSRAVRSRRLGAALRGEVSRPSVDALVEQIRAQSIRRIDGLLASTGKARAAVVGSEKTLHLLRTGRGAALVVLASDLSPRVRRDVLLESARSNVPVAVYGDRARLGVAFARAEVGVVAVTNDGLAAALKRELALLDAMSADDSDETIALAREG